MLPKSRCASRVENCSGVCYDCTFTKPSLLINVDVVVAVSANIGQSRF